MTGTTEPPLALELLRVRVPLNEPHHSAHGTDTHRDSILVAWTASDGTTGWGECPTPTAPGYPTGTTDEAWASLVGTLAPAALAGRSTLGIVAPAASAALVDAALDAWLRSAGRSLSQHLGATASAVPRTAVISGDDADRLVARARGEVASGAAMVKVKVRSGADVELVAAVVESAGVPVAADANGSLATDPVALGRLDALGLAYVEQPLPASATWDELAALRRSLRTPVALDESLLSPDAVRSAVMAGAADVVSVKPARMGGVRAASAALEVAADAAVDAFVGGMFELGIGRATSAALAALPACTLPTDLGPSDRYVAEDVCDPVVTDEGGRLVVPTGPGCGRTPVRERLDRWTVDSVRLTR